MSVLRGSYDGKVDAKGRVSVPSKCRKLLPEQLVIAKHPTKELPALVVYPEEDYNQWFKTLMQSMAGEKANVELQAELIDEYYKDSLDVTPDDLGRITIPPFLREYAGITNAVVITGSLDHLIIRTPEMLKKYEQRFANNSVYATSASNPTE